MDQEEEEVDCRGTFHPNYKRKVLFEGVIEVVIPKNPEPEKEG
jgi:hypothetical protein